MATASPVEAAAPVEMLQQELAENGYCWVREEWDATQFRDCCEALGEIIYEAEVRMGGDRPRNYQLPAAIGFHTDHVTAEIAAWRCVTIEPGEGAMQLLDLAPIGDSLSETQREALARVGIVDNAAWGGGAPIPLALPRSDGLRYHYVPWLQRFPGDWDAKDALDAFERGFQEAVANNVVELEVVPGQCVFVDNHRVAHGRAAIAPESKRHLTRYWIRRHSRG